MIRTLVLTLIVLIGTGCMSTTVVLHPSFDPHAKPSYEDYFDSYLFSLIGEGSVNLAQVCMDQKPLAVQRKKLADDVLLSLLTLQIYTPSTVRVWCGEY